MRWQLVSCHVLNEFLQVTRLSDRKMLETIESGIRTGLPVLIEDVGEELVGGLMPSVHTHYFTARVYRMLRWTPFFLSKLLRKVAFVDM